MKWLNEAEGGMMLRMISTRTMRASMPVVAALALGLAAGSALAGGILRVAMTASDVPTTTGAPDNGYEGLRFLGYPVFEGLVLWDLKSADKLAGLRPGLAERWEQDPNDNTKWIFHLRKGVKFHDGSDFNADAALGGRGLLLQRFGEFVRAFLHLVEQPHVLDRNHRLVENAVTSSI
jgi:ABC-type transport system substrate-binding protein